MEDHDQIIKSDEEHEVLRSIRSSRIVLPILLGLLVVGYLFWQKFNPEEFKKIDWNQHTLFWIGVAALILVIRHLAYAWRLHALAGGAFSWMKSIELIFIWEFSSAVSPTSIGGSAVALFVLAQEKLKTAKVTAIVLYTVVLDTAFFIFTLILLYLLFGSNMIRPNLHGWSDLDGWFFTFLASYLFMATYGFFFFYGLFIRPDKTAVLLRWVTRFRWLRRFRKKAAELGRDFVVSSKELKNRGWSFHLTAFASTAIAWSMRFLLLNALIIAIVPTTDMHFMAQFALYARLEAMFVIMAFSPTPGGAGFAEFVFGGFLSDYVPRGISLIVALIWRALAYYSYLLAGVVIIPNWIRKLINRRKVKKLEQADR